MPARVRLSATAGPLLGHELVFEERTTCIAGRAEGCEPQIAEPGSSLTSRHHCLFDINPPDLRVRDLGSLNGTHVNGVEIGRRKPGQTPEEGARLQFRERDLEDGDEVALGRTVLRVSVFVPATCVRCLQEIAESREREALREAGLHECEDCRARTRDADPPNPPQPPHECCNVCGRDVSGEAGRRGGEIVCDACRRDPSAIVERLLSRARTGEGALTAIGAYEVVRELGRGGQGVVYLARHRASGELIALKLLLAEVAVQESARNAFLREIETAQALRHPNVVEFRDSGSSGATFYCACEYCDGGSVDQLMVERGGRLAVEEALAIATQALDGLAYAHTVEIPGLVPAGRAGGPGGFARGLVHRDIKPSNILLAGSGSACVAKVADFGLSKAFDQAGLSGHTRTGSVGGTVAFMARQQIVSYKFAKPEVDVWAMAASLYHMLTGALPRDFPPGTDAIAVVLDRPAVPIRRRDSSVPPRLAEVIDEALIERPEIAIKSAAELKRALEQAV